MSAVTGVVTERLPIPVLVGATVTLRPHSPDDLDAVYERCVDPDTQRFTTIPLDYTRAMAKEYLTGLFEPREDRISWAIEVAGRYAGTIDLRRQPVAAGGGDLGFVTHPGHRGRGVMTEAVGLVLRHAFDDLGWATVQWQAHAGNWGSLKAVWRNGFPAPVFVPDLLVERGRLIDGWISTIHAGRAVVPVAWDHLVATLADGHPGSRGSRTVSR